MRDHAVNQLNNFICGWYAEDTTICDKLIEYHTAYPNKWEGRTNFGVNTKEKESIDCCLEESDTQSDYFKLLNNVCAEYIKQYPWCNAYSSWQCWTQIPIQHYKPTGAYHGWHSERTNTIPNVANRHLVFMTYLNDVTDAGETEFFHQKVKIKPEKGLTLIWPADWTFTHRGIPSPTQEKYIITGWFNYI